MKCDNIRTTIQMKPFFPNMLNNSFVEVCLKEDVEEAIAELKAENLNLKAKNVELQSFYDLHGNVDNYIDQLKAQNESLLYALNEAVAKQGFRNLNIPESLARLMHELADAKGENRRQQHEIAELKAENERLKEGK